MVTKAIPHSVNYPALEECYSENFSLGNIFPRQKIKRSVHENTRGLIKIVEEIIGKKEDQPVKQQDFSHSERGYKNYYRSTPIWYSPSKWYSPLSNWYSPLFVNRSIHIGNVNNYNHVIYQKQPSNESEEARKRKQDKADDEQRKTIAIVAGIALFPFVYVFGRLLGTRETINDQMVALNNANNDWKKNKNCYENDFQKSIKIISEKSKSILDKRMRRNSFQLVGVVSFIGSCVLAIAGGLNKSNDLVKAGVVSGGVVIGGSALYYLCTLGFSHGRPARKSESEVIGEQIQFLNNKEKYCLYITNE